MGLSIVRIFILLCFETCIHLKNQMFQTILNPQALFFGFFFFLFVERNLKSCGAFHKSGHVSPSILDKFSKLGKSILPT